MEREYAKDRAGRGGPGRGWESLDGLTGHFLRWMQNGAALYCTVNVLITIQAELHTYYFYLILNMAMNKGV